MTGVGSATARARRPTCVVVGVGIAPERPSLRRDAGLAVDNGVVVDAHLRTSRPAHLRRRRRGRRLHPLLGQPLRVEHWANALPAGPGRRPHHARPGRRSTTGCRTSSPTSTTSAWSTSATSARRLSTRSSSAATAGAGEFVAFWLAGRAGAGRHERQRLGRHRAVEQLITLRPAGRRRAARGP